MRGRDMVNSLEYRLEDENHVNFSATQKIQALNDAQRQVIAMCSTDALPHLQVSEDLDTVQTDSDLGGLKYFALPEPAGEPLMNRVIKAYDNTNDRFIEMVSPNGFETNTSYSYGTLGTLMRNRLYVSTGDTAIESCVLIYISTPADIADDVNQISYVSDSIQQAIVEMAESLLWRQDNRQQRAQGASSNAIAIITAINASV